MEHIWWPLFISLALIIIARMFRTSISKVLERTKKVSRDGIEIGGSSASEQQLESTTVERSVTDANSLLINSLKGPALLSREAEIREWLGTGNPSAEREETLIQYCGVVAFCYQFERLYRWIYGSQLSFLQQLNESRPGLDLETVRLFYASGVEQYPDVYESYSFERWLEFLKSHDLLLVEAENVRIADVGVEFLRYVLNMGYSTRKAG